MLLCRWYQHSRSVLRWDNNFSDSFYIRRGVRQVSILSPHMLNIFLYGMLKNVHNLDVGIRMNYKKYNCFAYAEDVILFSTMVPDLQSIIDVCTQYVDTWRFKFGFKKSNCAMCGLKHFHSDPKWYLGHFSLDNVNSLEELQTMCYNSAGGYPFKEHVESRNISYRLSYYRLANVGLSYTGLANDIKAHLGNTVCLPSLTYIAYVYF